MCRAGLLLRSGMNDATAEPMVAVDGNIRDGELISRTGDLSRLLGRPTTPLLETLQRATPS